MNIPGFTAETSLQRSVGHYQSGRRASNSSARLMSPVYPAMMMSGGLHCGNCVGGECAELHCFEHWTHSGGGGGGPYGGGGGGGFGGGGGGGGGPTRRHCVDSKGRAHRHGTTVTETTVLGEGGPENTYVSRHRCSNGRWNLV